ncbi:MAG: ABC transporter ATP-binding protein [Clostridia bacterium]|nr:ABC transporter ATP-binding protein [Clostridia bacterium]
MIALEQVTKRYGPVEALKEVSFRIPRGGITGLLGRNGAGKTTALNLMTGYFPPTAGRVLVGGKDMRTEARACKRMIGYLPEKPPLYDEMTVEEYLRFVCELKEVRREGAKAHVDEIIGLCGLGEVRHRVTGHLSKGYRQRAGIAQALCGSPDVLILDEPTVGLDPKQTAEMRELIRELGKDRTVVFSSHILSEVQQLCDRAVILNEGRMIRSLDLGAEDGENIRLRLRAAGPASRVMPALRALDCVKAAEELPGEMTEAVLTCLRKDGQGAAEDQIFRVCAGLNAPIRRLEEEQETLEQVFLRETEH